MDAITGGRIPPPGTPMVAGSHPFVVEKSSGLPGKAVLETPGLVVGSPDKHIAAIGIGMTLTESMIELAGAMGLDAIIAHHPVADAANSGGVPLKPYLELYNLALFELHEAFHGLHPGIAFLHGHRVLEKDLDFAGIAGNVIIYGQALPEIRTAGDILRRLDGFMNLETEQKVLSAEASIRCCEGICETSLTAMAKIMHGKADAPVSHVLHVFPHAGFTAQHLAMALERFPETDTIIVSISRMLPSSDLLSAIRDRGLSLVIGNSHAQEIYENGLPLAYAIGRELPELELFMLRERITACPIEQFGNPRIRDYGRQMATHLVRPKQK